MVHHIELRPSGMETGHSQIICGEQLKIIALKIIRHADCMPDDK